MNYEQYIHSPQWEARKTLFFAKHAKQCRRCGTKENIQLHHHTYERMGHEHDDDLVPVCEICHRLIHRHHKAAYGGKSGHLTVATFEVLDLEKKRSRRRRSKQDAEKKYQFVPRNRRGAAPGRSSLDWREECRDIKVGTNRPEMSVSHGWR